MNIDNRSARGDLVEAAGLAPGSAVFGSAADTLFASGDISHAAIWGVGTLSGNAVAVSARQWANFNSVTAATVIAATGGTFATAAQVYPDSGIQATSNQEYGARLGEAATAASVFDGTGNGNYTFLAGDANSNSLTVSGNGNNTLTLGNGNSNLLQATGTGTNILTAGNGTGNFLNAKNGTDTLYSGNGAGDVLQALTGGNILNAGGGAGDTLIAKGGGNTVNGGSGGDTFEFYDYGNTVNAGTGTNTLMAMGWPSAAGADNSTVSLAGDVINGGTGT